MIHKQYILEYNVDKLSFRNNKIMSLFELDNINNIKNYDITIDNDFNWNIGVVFGSSGSGKSSLIREIFEKSDDYFVFRGFVYDNNKSVLDNIDNNIDINEIIEMLTKIGFNTPKDWLLPYSLLSTGQKMRFDIVKSILEHKNKIIVFDEFTSVVDRVVAKCLCLCIERYIRKHNIKIIFVSCHNDIIDWLKPDWIFDMNKQEYKKIDVPRQRAITNFIIYKTGKEHWKNIFSKYHYMTTSLPKNVECFEIYLMEKNKEILVGFCAVSIPIGSDLTHRIISRIVILPDYQGIGIGSRFLDRICYYYISQNCSITISTSNLSFIKSLMKQKSWKYNGIKRIENIHNKNGNKKKGGSNRKIVSFKYNRFWL